MPHEATAFGHGASINLGVMANGEIEVIPCVAILFIRGGDKHGVADAFGVDMVRIHVPNEGATCGPIVSESRIAVEVELQFHYAVTTRSIGQGHNRILRCV